MPWTHTLTRNYGFHNLSHNSVLKKYEEYGKSIILSPKIMKIMLIIFSCRHSKIMKPWCKIMNFHNFHNFRSKKYEKPSNIMTHNFIIFITFTFFHNFCGDPKHNFIFFSPPLHIIVSPARPPARPPTRIHFS